MVEKVDFMTWLGSETGRAAVAGALGGVVRWITLRSSFQEGLGTLCVGGVSAVYLGPIAITVVESTLGKIITNSDLSGLADFLVGVGGMALTGMIIDVFNRRREIIKGESDVDK